MFRVIVLLSFLLFLPLTATAEEQCRRVLLSGTIKCVPLPKAGFRGTANGPEGKFKIELLFAEHGGEIIKQENFVELVKIKNYAFAGAKACSINLPEKSKAPRPFDVWAELTPDSVVNKYGSDPKEYVSDQLDLTIRKLPPLSAVSFSTKCGTGPSIEMSDYGASYNQLLLPFSTRKILFDITLNKIDGKKSSLSLDIPGASQANLEWEQQQTLVPCNSFK